MFSISLTEQRDDHQYHMYVYNLTIKRTEIRVLTLKQKHECGDYIANRFDSRTTMER